MEVTPELCHEVLEFVGEQLLGLQRGMAIVDTLEKMGQPPLPPEELTMIYCLLEGEQFRPPLTTIPQLVPYTPINQLSRFGVENEEEAPHIVAEVIQPILMSLVNKDLVHLDGANYTVNHEFAHFYYRDLSYKYLGEVAYMRVFVDEAENISNYSGVGITGVKNGKLFIILRSTKSLIPGRD